MSVATAAVKAASRRPKTGLAHLVASGVLWGTGGLTGTLLARVTGLSPLSVAAYRLTAGGALIVIFLTLTGRRWPRGRAAWARIGAVGLLAAVFQGSYFTAVSLTSVSLATLVTIGSAPVIVLAVEVATRRRRLTALTAAITLLVLSGLGLMAGFPHGFQPAATLASVAMALLAAAGFATVTLIGSRPVPRLDDLAVTGFGFTMGGLLLMPLAAVVAGIGFHPAPTALGLLVALGTGPTAVAYTLYFRGLRTAAASTGALLTLLEPLTGAVLAALVLGDRLGITGMAGAALLAVAVILTARARAGGGQAGYGTAHR